MSTCKKVGISSLIEGENKEINVGSVIIDLKEFPVGREKILYLSCYEHPSHIRDWAEDILGKTTKFDLVITPEAKAISLAHEIANNGQKGWFGGYFAFDIQLKERIGENQFKQYISEINEVLKACQIINVFGDTKSPPIKRV